MDEESPVVVGVAPDDLEKSAGREGADIGPRKEVPLDRG